MSEFYFIYSFGQDVFPLEKKKIQFLFFVHPHSMSLWPKRVVYAFLSQMIIKDNASIHFPQDMMNEKVWNVKCFEWFDLFLKSTRWVFRFSYAYWSFDVVHNDYEPIGRHFLGIQSLSNCIIEIFVIHPVCLENLF